MGPGHNHPPRDPIELEPGVPHRLPLKLRAFQFIAKRPVVLRMWAGHLPDKLHPIIAPHNTDSYAFSHFEPWTYVQWAAENLDGDDDPQPRMLVNWSD